MMQQHTGRSHILDLLKGIAIIAVVLYHAGLLTFGYLGVEVFLVVSGYLTTKSILRQYEGGRFSYWRFLASRLVRLWPLVLVVSVVSLAAGYFAMLPTNYKNTAETALGSGLFLNNFVQYVTAGDYWDAANEYKPLMHTWYVGLIFQFYVLFPLFFMGTHRLATHWKRALAIVLSIVGLGSLTLYLLPISTTGFNFYMLPSRLFEFTAGALLAFPATSTPTTAKRWGWAFLIVLALLLVPNDTLDATQYRLLLTVALTTLLIAASRTEAFNMAIPHIKPVALLGMASYSLYLWHQVVLAFYRNTCNDELSAGEYGLVIGLSVAVGLASYYLLEQPIDWLCKLHAKGQTAVLVVCFLVLLPLGYLSMQYYRQEGVVRDIPELEVRLSRPDTWVPQAYNAAVYGQDHDFPMNGKENVLVVGDSYARDWYNVVRESVVDDSINLSYHENPDSTLSHRIEQADCIFLATHGDYSRFSDYLPRMMRKVFYRVGDKRFFSSPGVIYNRRGSMRYFQQRINIPADIAASNQRESHVFGSAFINTMDVMKEGSGRYSIFTPEHLLISHDGLHLTKAGARYYARKMRVDSLLAP
jgi:peptidoglycan/LPS O-acetylase OafA/YrhL